MSPNNQRIPCKRIEETFPSSHERTLEMNGESRRQRKLDRREFLTVAGLAALGGTVALAEKTKEHSAVGNPDSTISRENLAPTRQIGISDEAYKRAWNRSTAMVAKMTLAEKIKQTGGENGWGAVPAIERMDMPHYDYYTGEALHGLVRGGPVTSFPVPLGMACSWNPGLALQVYTAVSDEARAYHKRDKNGLSYYSPQTLNLHRDPRWGRSEEAPGEDPFLAGAWSVQVVRGMQGDDPNYLKTTPCAKHFICNNTEANRMGASATVNPRSFWEYYTRAYRMCTIDGGVFTFMAAYNAVNGVPCSADKALLTDLLRDQWGFRGYVTADCDAVHTIWDQHHFVPTATEAAALAIKAGCDFDCGTSLPDNLQKAIQDGLITEPEIDTSLIRILTTRTLLGEFDNPADVPYHAIDFAVVDSARHRQLALEAARQSIVLLKNEGSFLPLDRSALKRIAVIGPMADAAILGGGYSGAPFIKVSPFEGLRGVSALEVSHLDGYAWPDQVVSTSKGVRSQNSSTGGTNMGWIDDNAWIEYEAQDFTGKTSIAMHLASTEKNGRIEVHLDSLDGPVVATLDVPATGGPQKWQRVESAISPVDGRHKVFLRFNGAKKNLCNLEWFRLLPVAVPAAAPGSLEVVLSAGCTVSGPKDEKVFEDAVELATRSDIVVMVCGVDKTINAESKDRNSIDLPLVQQELIKACFAANSKMVLVLSSNNTIAVNWEQEHVPAIVSAMFAGQAQGAAIADVLFGIVNPAGKTCCTWYRSIDQLPPVDDYDILKGRTYLYFEGKPLYPFGHGLSYTTFSFLDLHVSSRSLREGDSIQVAVKVKNTGTRKGAEVAQLYVTAPATRVKRPLRQLVGFQRVELEPGEAKTVTFTLPYDQQALWFWDEQRHRFALEPGALKLAVGSSSVALPLSTSVRLHAASRQLNERRRTVYEAAVT